MQDSNKNHRKPENKIQRFQFDSENNFGKTTSYLNFQQAVSVSLVLALKMQFLLFE